MRTALRATHAGLIHVITVGVLTQAVLAGQFISGVSNAIPAHGAVGGVLELGGLLLLLVAIAHRISGERSRAALIGSVVLATALQVQAGLGWAPGQIPTAIHVPLGVCVFAGTLFMSVTITRALRVRPARRAIRAGGRRQPPAAISEVEEVDHMT
jgi:hypothetical protein